MSVAACGGSGNGDDRPWNNKSWSAIFRAAYEFMDEEDDDDDDEDDDYDDDDDYTKRSRLPEKSLPPKKRHILGESKSAEEMNGRKKTRIKITFKRRNLEDQKPQGQCFAVPWGCRGVRSTPRRCSSMPRLLFDLDADGDKPSLRYYVTYYTFEASTYTYLRRRHRKWNTLVAENKRDDDDKDGVFKKPKDRK